VDRDVVVLGDRGQEAAVLAQGGDDRPPQVHVAAAPRGGLLLGVDVERLARGHAGRVEGKGADHAAAHPAVIRHRDHTAVREPDPDVVRVAQAQLAQGHELGAVEAVHGRAPVGRGGQELAGAVQGSGLEHGPGQRIVLVVLVALEIPEVHGLGRGAAPDVAARGAEVELARDERGVDRQLVALAVMHRGHHQAAETRAHGVGQHPGVGPDHPARPRDRRDHRLRPGQLARGLEPLTALEIVHLEALEPARDQAEPALRVDAAQAPAQAQAHQPCPRCSTGGLVARAGLAHYVAAVTAGPHRSLAAAVGTERGSEDHGRVSGLGSLVTWARPVPAASKNRRARATAGAARVFYKGRPRAPAHALTRSGRALARCPTVLHWTATLYPREGPST
jgi:hypothetical protein